MLHPLILLCLCVIQQIPLLLLLFHYAEQPFIKPLGLNLPHLIVMIFFYLFKALIRSHFICESTGQSCMCSIRYSSVLGEKVHQKSLFYH